MTVEGMASQHANGEFGCRQLPPETQRAISCRPIRRAFRRIAGSLWPFCRSPKQSGGSIPSWSFIMTKSATLALALLLGIAPGVADAQGDHAAPPASAGAEASAQGSTNGVATLGKGVTTPA